MDKPRKPSINLLAFEREVARLEKLVLEAKAQGITFITSPIPQRPKKITAQSVERLRKIGAPDIAKKGYTKDPITGVLTPVRTFTPTNRSHFPSLGTVSEPSYPHIPKPETKVKLSDEELHRIRSLAAKKAAKSRAEHEARDPEFRARMQAIRRRNLEKAREAVRKWEQEHPEEAKKRAKLRAKKAAESRKQHELEDPEFARKMREIRKKNIEKVREKREENDRLRKEGKLPSEPAKPRKPSTSKGERKPKQPKTEEPEAETPPPPEEPYYPQEGEILLANLYEKINGATNRAIGRLLLDVIEDELSIDPDALLQRLAEADKNEALEQTQSACYESSGAPNGDVPTPINSAKQLALLITGGNLPPSFDERLDEAAREDFPNYYKRDMYSRNRTKSSPKWYSNVKKSGK